MAISKEVLDELMKSYKGPDDLTGPGGLLKELTKALVERAMQAEMTEPLGYEKNSPIPKTTTNRRNGSFKKQVRSDQGEMEIEVPRDRDADFEPVIIPKNQRDFKGIKHNVLEGQIDLLEEYGTTENGLKITPKSSDKDKSSDHLGNLKKQLKKYSNEQEEISKEANKVQNESQKAFKAHNILSYAVTLLQVAIGVSAVSALTRKRWLWIASMAVAFIGLAFLGLGFYNAFLV